MPFEGDDRALLDALQRKQPPAIAAFCERYGDHVKRVLGRILGADSELPDLHHDVFVRALRSLPKLDKPSGLKPWLSSIAVHVARSWITRKRTRSWLWFLPNERLPEMAAEPIDNDARAALRATYLVLDKLPVDQRIAFSLRFIDGMDLTAVAACCDTSLSTIKRRLKRAKRRFEIEARHHAELLPWLEGGSRWRNPSTR